MNAEVSIVGEKVTKLKATAKTTEKALTKRRTDPRLARSRLKPRPMPNFMWNDESLAGR